MSANDRELKVRLLELSARLITPSTNLEDVIRVANTLYASLPPGDGDSKVRKNMAKAFVRESRTKQTAT